MAAVSASWFRCRWQRCDLAPAEGTGRAMALTDGPTDVVWDVTYACPLRCTHCYSESGRRPSRQLGRADLLRVADALVALRPAGIALAGGEPLLVPGIAEVAGRISAAGIPLVLYTSGWTLTSGTVDDVSRVFSRVVVSVDGASAALHDRIRGRAGSFDRAVRALGLLDRAAAERRARGDRPVPFGVDCVVVRSNLDRLADFCTVLAPRFPELGMLRFSAAEPSGLASRAGFAEHELLTDAEADRLADAAFARHLQSLAPATVQVVTSDIRALQMRPDQVAGSSALRTMQVEPDGQVRAMAIYEGTVGSLLQEPPAELWRRAVARWSDPYVVRTLSGVRTMRDWAAAVRRLDQHFGSAEVRARIERRPAYVAATPA